VSNAVLHHLPSSLLHAQSLAARIGLPLHEIALHRFPDGEIRVTVGAAAPTVIIYAPLDRPNDKLITLLFAAEALRRAGAKRLVLVAPYLCYMRQDAAFHAGEAISQRAIGKLLAHTVDRVITVDAHLHRTADIRTVFPGIAAENLSAMPVIADALAAIERATIVAGPDSESRPWVADLAGRIGLDHVVGRKMRKGDRSVEIDFSGERSVAGRPVLLVDDIVSSGGTLVTAAKSLLALDATSVDAIVTHALFPPEMTVEFTRAGIRSIRSTTSVSHATNAIPLDAVLAAALKDELQIRTSA
jgi:ribose-phosphate pyrophosphokinase